MGKLVKPYVQPLRDFLLDDAPTALAACCGFDLCHKYILYLYFKQPLQHLRGDNISFPFCPKDTEQVTRLCKSTFRFELTAPVAKNVYMQHTAMRARGGVTCLD